MKLPLLFLTLGAFLAIPAIAQSTDSTNAPAVAPAAPAPAPPHAAKPGALTKDEVTELNKARAAALKANPDLVAERKDLDDKSKAWSKKVDEAAVAIDPNVAAILAKREAGKPKPAAPHKDKPKATDKTPLAPTPSTNAPAATPPTN